jgi:glutamine---fructose-6-phosphate transaminase (isomerizing)
MSPRRRCQQSWLATNLADLDPNGFWNDLHGAADSLEALRAQWPDWPNVAPRDRVLLVGMGSSYFAALSAASTLRARGINAVAELASASATWPPTKQLLVVALSASGSSVETLAFVERYRAVATTVAVTNSVNSALATLCDHVIDMAAGVEVGGVACRSYMHSVALLHGLVDSFSDGANSLEWMGRSIDAASELLGGLWLAPLSTALDGGSGVWMLAPSERLGSALHSALMVREGPRRMADGCETGDWSHVDVYLTKTLDYRAIVFAGSPWEVEAARWMRERGSTVVSIGGPFDGAVGSVRYRGDDDERVAAVVETLVPSLIAAQWWLAQ